MSMINEIVFNYECSSRAIRPLKIVLTLVQMSKQINEDFLCVKATQILLYHFLTSVPTPASAQLYFLLYHSMTLNAAIKLTFL